MWRNIGIGIFGILMSEGGQGLEHRLQDIRLINPCEIHNGRVALTITESTSTETDSLRSKIRDDIMRACPNALAFGVYLDDIEKSARELKELVPDTLKLYIALPKYLLEDSLRLWIEVSKAESMLYLYSDHGLLLEAEAKTGGYQFHDDKKVDFGTPNGTYYINRLVKQPYWYPPDWAESEVDVVRPGDQNPLGEWMAELCNIPTTAGYDFTPSNQPTMLRIHGSNYSKRIPNRFFDALPTHGCVRLKIEDTRELFEALMRYAPNRPSKNTGRGTILPLNTPIRVTIRD